MARTIDPKPKKIPVRPARRQRGGESQAEARIGSARGRDREDKPERKNGDGTAAPLRSRDLRHPPVRTHRVAETAATSVVASGRPADNNA